MTKSLDPLSAKLYDEMLARIKQDDDTPPVKEGACERRREPARRPHRHGRLPTIHAQRDLAFDYAFLRRS